MVPGGKPEPQLPAPCQHTFFGGNLAQMNARRGAMECAVCPYQFSAPNSLQLGLSSTVKMYSPARSAIRPPMAASYFKICSIVNSLDIIVILSGEIYRLLSSSKARFISPLVTLPLKKSSIVQSHIRPARFLFRNTNVPKNLLQVFSHFLSSTVGKFFQPCSSFSKMESFK